MIKYCSTAGCGFRNEYSVNPPQKCAKCHTSFSAVFRAEASVKTEVAPKRVKPVAAPVSKSNRPPVRLLDSLRNARAGITEETETEEVIDEVADEVYYEESGAQSADELAASLNPDDMIRVVVESGDEVVKVGDLFKRT